MRSGPTTWSRSPRGHSPLSADAGPQAESSVVAGARRHDPLIAMAGSEVPIPRAAGAQPYPTKR